MHDGFQDGASVKVCFLAETLVLTLRLPLRYCDERWTSARLRRRNRPNHQPNGVTQTREPLYWSNAHTHSCQIERRLRKQCTVVLVCYGKRLSKRFKFRNMHGRAVASSSISIAPQAPMETQHVAVQYTNSRAALRGFSLARIKRQSLRVRVWITSSNDRSRGCW